jgi:hypothetical protein
LCDDIGKIEMGKIKENNNKNINEKINVFLIWGINSWK